jgi:hypothetical protein
MTELEALENCLKHWVFILNHPKPQEYAAKIDYFATNLLIPRKNHCYLCEYVKEHGKPDYIDELDCSVCPLIGYAWGPYDGEGVQFACENDLNSPYNAWVNCDTFSEAVEAIERMSLCIENALADLKGGEEND